MPAPILLVRKPSPKLAEGLLTHIEDARSCVNYDLALKQWQAYHDAIKAEGWDVREVDEALTQPDSVFIEDALVSFAPLVEGARGLLLITNTSAPTRAPERAGAKAAADKLAKEIKYDVAELAKGHLEGGDLLKVGNKVYVGQTLRTNSDGADELQRLLAPLGYKVVKVKVTKALHLKSAMTALPDGTVIGYEPIVDDTSVFDSFLAVPEAHGVAVVQLSPYAASVSKQSAKLIMSSGAPETTKLLRQKGYEVVVTDISEFEKLEGCVTCLSVRVRPN